MESGTSFRDGVATAKAEVLTQGQWYPVIVDIVKNHLRIVKNGDHKESDSNQGSASTVRFVLIYLLIIADEKFLAFHFVPVVYSYIKVPGFQHGTSKISHSFVCLGF